MSDAEVIMPAFDMSQESATLLRWLKSAGEWVQEGEPVMEIETDKMTVEVEAPAAGFLADLRAEEGEVVPVGQVVAVLLERRAESEGGLAGVGPETAGNGAPPDDPIEPVVTAEYRTETLTVARRRIAARLTASYQEAPRFALSRTVDMTEALALVASHQAEGQRMSLTAVIAAAVAATLQAHRELNAHLVADKLRVYERVNLGIAVASPAGLVVPVLAGADRLALNDLADQLAALVERAREGRLAASDLHPATFTVSNLGMLGIEQFTAIINPPEVAILAVGSVKPRPFADDGELTIRDQLTLTLVSDHRVVDGADGARFLGDLTDRLEDRRAST
jgi:pyruvate dehydrogenase E2 component (dihydrolipoamide acetyltransferase)